MPSNRDTLLRQWHMLRMLPRYPHKITVQEIRQRLGADHFDVTERTVQRDLKELSLTFPLVSDEREKPFGWSWQKDAPGLDLPGLDVSEALTLTLAEQHLRLFFPPATLELLAPRFRMAREFLDRLAENHGAKRWIGKVRSVPSTQPLLPPNINIEIQGKIYDALLRDKRVAIRYRKRGQQAVVEYTISPLAIIQRGPVVYLSCTIAGHKDPRLLALQRIEQAEILDEPVIRPAAYNLDQLIASGAMGFGNGDSIRLVVLFTQEAGAHLYETPIAKNQKLAQTDDNRLRLEAEVPDTTELRWWLLAFGDGAEVIEPPSLRTQMANTVRAMMERYRQS